MDDQTGETSNFNKDNFEDTQNFPLIVVDEDDAISKNDGAMNLDEEIADTTFIRVTNKRKRRFRTTIKCIHVPGDNINSKINNIYVLLANKNGFLECKPFFDRNNKEAWITAIFDNQEAAIAATEMQLFENNDFKLTLLKDRGDDDVQQRTLVVRDLPLDVNRSLLRAILEDKFGDIEALRLRTAGPWYRADVTFAASEKIESNLDCWAIQYKKDFCRIAPAYYTRENIEERNQFTVKLTNLPFGMTPVDLKEILKQVKAKTCFIPRTRNRYIRKRFAYVSFASDEDLQKVMTNIRVMYNDTELFWELEDQKTCHKCGSSKHLVAECEEKESAENYKEYKNQFSNIYSKYKVPNYRNLTKKNYNNNNDNRNTQQNQTNNQTNNKKPQANDGNLKNLMENLIKSLTKDIEEKFDNITKQLADVNNRIKLIEIKTGLDKPKAQPRTVNKNTTAKYNMAYIPTLAELDKDLQPNNNETGKPQEILDNTVSNNKRPLSNSDGSSGDDTTSTQNKGRDVHKPRRKSFKISNDNNEKPAKEHEINNIKATQKNLEKDISELKGMFQQFTIQWFNAQPNNGNGSSTTNFLT